MVALLRFKGGDQFRPLPPVILIQPIAEFAGRNLVFGTAGYSTGPAVDAFSGIDNQCIAF